MRLDQALVARGLCRTRSQAEAAIRAGLVLVNGAPADKPGRVVRDGDTLALRDEARYASRGGWKLEAALTRFQVTVAGRVCLDAGASTGGFTDCLLQHGARRVYAVDVGYGQLAWRLRQDPRVVVMERTNLRHLQADALPEAIDLVTLDLSFIGLGKVLPAVAGLLTARGEVVALVKPQFEAGRKDVGKGGVVRAPSVHRRVLEQVAAEAQALGFTPKAVMASPILGPNGNVEFLMHLARTPGSGVTDAELGRAVDEGRLLVEQQHRRRGQGDGGEGSGLDGEAGP
jgi:23S rRNA (cytidine1920-2'-O)/16S rRNA (cytidine1409-2'-O)-methyltransferase